jgi:hypothetical protein
MEHDAPAGRSPIQFHPNALLVAAGFGVLVWLAVISRFWVPGLVLEALAGWGLLNFVPDDWPRRARS